MSSTPKKALGKGLAALIGDGYSDYTSEEGSIVVREIAITEIVANKDQPRRYFDTSALEELKESIAVHGILQPILVRSVADTDPTQYEIIAGERRWRAAQLAGLSAIPAIIKEFDASKTLEVALLENIQREDLNALEEAAAYFRLMEEFKYTQEELARAVGKSRSHIANLLRLLTLPEHIKRALERSEVTMGHARAVLNHPHADRIIEQVVKRGLNVRQTETLAKQLLKPSAPASERPATPPKPSKRSAPPTTEDPDLAALEEAITQSLGLRVNITYLGEGGVVSIDYDSLTDLDLIIRRLGGNAL